MIRRRLCCRNKKSAEDLRLLRRQIFSAFAFAAAIVDSGFVRQGIPVSGQIALNPKDVDDGSGDGACIPAGIRSTGKHSAGRANVPGPTSDDSAANAKKKPKSRLAFWGRVEGSVSALSGGARHERLPRPPEPGQ